LTDAAWGGLSALNNIGLIATQGVALGWHIAGPLVLKNAKSFAGIHCQIIGIRSLSQEV